jgi:hypothetical protein
MSKIVGYNLRATIWGGFFMASEAIYKVFVSSTFDDLREERAEVQKALLKLNCLPVGMELFPAADDDTWDFIKEQIDDSDYYIVLVGGRYGSLAPDGVSFTEKEYDYAREREVPSIGFVHQDRGNIPLIKSERDPMLVAKLDAFVSKIKTRPVRTFTSAHQLAAEVTTSLIDLKRTKRRIGFVRTDQVVEYKRYAELLEKVASLEKELNHLRSQEQQPFLGWDALFELDVFGVLFSTTIGHILVALASILVETDEELYISRLLLNTVVLADNNSKVFSLVMSDREMEALQTDESPRERELTSIRERLFSANLIDVSRGISVDHQPGPRLWRLTDYGRQQVSLLRYRFGLGGHLALNVLDTTDHAPFLGYDDVLELDIFGVLCSTKLGCVVVAVAWIMNKINEEEQIVEQLFTNMFTGNDRMSRSVMTEQEVDAVARRKWAYPHKQRICLIRNILMNANLLEVAESTSAEGQVTRRFWKLTDYGRRQVSLLRYRFRTNARFELKLVEVKNQLPFPGCDENVELHIFGFKVCARNSDIFVTVASIMNETNEEHHILGEILNKYVPASRNYECGQRDLAYRDRGQELLELAYMFHRDVIDGIRGVCLAQTSW